MHFFLYVTAFAQMAAVAALSAVTSSFHTAEAFSMSSTRLIRTNMDLNMVSSLLPDIDTINSSQTKTRIPLVENTNDETLIQMQKRHPPIAASFTPQPFNPHPALSNCHLQTILGVFLRENPDCAYISKSDGLSGLTKVASSIANINSPNIQTNNGDATSTYWDERQRITTSCQQDFYTVDIKYATQHKTQYQSLHSKGMVIILHGLESNSNSSLSTDMAEAYVQDGFDVVCINFRGCCGEPKEQFGMTYHLGFTDDVRHFLQLMSELWQDDNSGGDTFEKRPIYLSGFSLGANVAIKTLGELGDSAMSLYNIHGAAVCGAPFDQELNNPRVDAAGFNNVVYGQNFLKSMKAKAQEKLELHCDGDECTTLFDYKGAMEATNIADFETAYIAPIFGFEDNIDYYKQTSCVYFMPGVAVPLYILNCEIDYGFRVHICLRDSHISKHSYLIHT